MSDDDRVLFDASEMDAVRAERDAWRAELDAQCPCSALRRAGKPELRCNPNCPHGSPVMSGVCEAEACVERQREAAVMRLVDERHLAAAGVEREALTTIAALGRVCPDFETCDHPACEDSCGAALIALEALKGHAPAEPEIARLRARLAAVERMDTPWPVHEMLKRLADAADHTLNEHGCDAHGWEGVSYARDAARAWLAEHTLLGRDPAPPAEGGG